MSDTILCPRCGDKHPPEAFKKKTRPGMFTTCADCRAAWNTKYAHCYQTQEQKQIAMALRRWRAPHVEAA